MMDWRLDKVDYLLGDKDGKKALSGSFKPRSVSLGGLVQGPSVHEV